MTAILSILQLAEKAGLPPGVLNVVTCSRNNAGEVGKMLCENPTVKKISFTGSTVVGKVGLETSCKTDIIISFRKFIIWFKQNVNM